MPGARDGHASYGRSEGGWGRCCGCSSRRRDAVRARGSARSLAGPRVGGRMRLDRRCVPAGDPRVTLPGPSLPGVIATANSQTAIGVEGELVEVEARVSGREHGATIIVGLPDRAVTEARERVRAGVIASELWWPQGRVVVNLAPGNVPKLGPRHDLAMAVAILAASDQLPRARAGKVLVLGELAFDGRLRPVHGALIAAETARRVGLEALVCPSACAPEAALVTGLPVYGARHLTEVVAWLNGELELAAGRAGARSGAGQRARSRRRARPAARAPRARARRRRRPQHAHDRPAGRRQDDARAAPARPAARVGRADRARGDARALGGRRACVRARERSAARRSAHRTTAPRRRRWWAAARARDRGRSRWRPVACSSWTS